MLVPSQHSICCPPGPAWSLTGVQYIPHFPRRVLNPAPGQGCQGQKLPTWLERIPRTHRQGMLMFLSWGRGGCVSDLGEPLLLRAHSLTGKTLESKEQWRTCILHIPKDGDLSPVVPACTRPDIPPVTRETEEQALQVSWAHWQHLGSVLHSGSRAGRAAWTWLCSGAGMLPVWSSSAGQGRHTARTTFIGRDLHLQKSEKQV